jgi:SNF2 family DNA or RNA helicase
MDTSQKQKVVKAFQNKKQKRVIIIQYVSAGLGLTLTAAHRIGLIEYAWGPNANRQVIDRGHRYTLKHPFLAQYNVFRNSLDAKTFETEARKKRITSFI